MMACEIAEALGGRRSGRGWIVRCPAHDDREPSLSIAEGHTVPILLRCWAGCAREAIEGALAARGLWPDQMIRVDRIELERRRHEHAARAAMENAAKEAEALAIWRAAQSIEPGGLADRYLRSRSFQPPYPPSLRQGTYRSLSGRVWPALIAGACRYPHRQVVCVQATPLKPPGVKAWSKPARCTAGRQLGAAVRVSPWREGQPIILTEGVEDALAVLQACPSATVWAILGADNAARVQLPLGAPVTLCLDGDAAGRRATDAAAIALYGRGHAVRRVHLPDGFDPAALLHKAA